MTPCRCTSLRTCASADGFRPSAGPSSNGRAEETRASLPASSNPKVGRANGLELLKSSLSSGRKREQTADGQRHAGQDPPSAEISKQRTQQSVANRTQQPAHQPAQSFPERADAQENGGVDPAADKEVVLITLTRPLIYLQPVAVDKAILVWLNYKNAFEYWAGGAARRLDQRSPCRGRQTGQVGPAGRRSSYFEHSFDNR